MKLWLKLYLFSILAFVVVFHAGSILVIERSHTNAIQREIDNAASLNLNLQTSVEAIIPVLRIYDSLDYERNVLARIAGEFANEYGGRRTYVEIRDAGETDRIVFSDIDFPMPLQREELADLAANELHSILRDIGDRTMLFTSNRTFVHQHEYVFTTIVDFTPLYEERTEQYALFARVDVAACLLYMLIMFFVSRGLTRSIDLLKRSAQVIAQGNFSERVSLRSKDEIGVLAHSFNEMADVVEEKITDLKQTNERQQRFIQNFTHELKTPLTSIIGYANYLRSTKYDEERFIDGLQVIYDEGKRLETLSTKLMDLIVLQEDRVRLKPLEMCAVITEIRPTLEMMAKEKRIKIVVEGEEGVLPMDKDLIKVMLFNFVDNAIKASSEGHTVTLHTGRRDGRYVLQVIDSGVGIAEEHQGKIFEPFYMVDPARTGSRSGAGLGLAICQSIAGAHRAEIRVKGGRGAGTTIEVVFAASGIKEEEDA